MQKRFILYFIFLTIPLIGQSFKFVSEFGNFKNAAALSITAGGNIYISDTRTNEIYKFDKNGKEDKSIGGYGWGIEAFDEPIDLFATPLNIYVADKNNNRIQIFDRELNFLSVFKTHENELPELSFNYPTCVAISSIGDLFILDSDNFRILKYDLNGNFVQQIGNYEAGSYKLNNPIKFSISRNGNIFVLDGNQIFVFDQFGNGFNKIPIDENLNNISIYDYKMTLILDNSLQILDLNNISNSFLEFHPKEISDSEIITDAAFITDKLYILTSKRVLEYSISKK